MKPLLPIAALLLVVSLACDRKTGVPSPSHAEDPKPPGDDIPLEAVRGISFITAPEPKAEGAWYPAEAISDENAAAIISSPVQGIVASITVPPGRRVAKGSILLSIQSPELAKLQADWLGARARLIRAKAGLARERRLIDSEAGAQRDMEAAESDAATAEAEAESARLALEARGARPGSGGASLALTAPAAGSVTAYSVQRGQGVSPGQELGRFQAMQATLVRVELPPPGAGSWASGASTEVRAASGQTWSAVVEGVPVALTQDTRRLSYRLRLIRGPWPMPGAPLEVRVALAKAVILPQVSLQQVEGAWGVFVKEDGQARFRPVRRGAELGGDVMVLEGVAPGEAVASEGAYLLKALLLKRKSGGDDHDH